MNQRFQKQHRNLTSGAIQNIRRHGQRFWQRPLVVFRQPTPGPARMAVAVAKAYGGSVRRHWIKRQVRTFFRKNKDLLGGYDYFWYLPKPSKQFSSHDLSASFERLQKRWSRP